MIRVLVTFLTLLAVTLAAAVLACDAKGGDCAAPRVVYHQPSYAPTYYAPPVVVKEVVHAPAIVAAPVIKDVVFTKYVPVIPIALVELAVLPTYSAQYVPPVQAAQPGIAPPPQAGPPQAPALAQQQSADMVKIMGALERINARLDRLEKGQPQVLPQAPKTPPAELAPLPKEEQITALAVVSNKCAACHSEKTAAEQGGNLVLISEGKLTELAPRQANKVLGKSYAGAMPPKDNKLSIAPLTDGEVAALVSQYAK